MIKSVITLFVAIFTTTSFANEAVSDIDDSGFKRVEFSMGYIYGEEGYGAKVKYQLSGYLVGFEVNSINLSDSYIFGPRTRDFNNESGDHWVLSASLGKDWSYGWLNAAVDIGIGYGVGGEHTNCTSESDNGFSFELCDYEIERAISIPMSATFVIGKGAGIGLSVTHAFSSLEHNTGLKIVIPFGSFD
jgi:hypothetical protein